MWALEVGPYRGSSSYDIRIYAITCYGRIVVWNYGDAVFLWFIAVLMMEGDNRAFWYYMCMI